MGLHLDIGVIRPQSAGIPVPVSERYFAGGQGTVRGFPEDELGPTDADGNHIGGLERAFLQAEARVPLFWRIGGVLFVDAGFIADRPPGINFKETAVGAGLGIRFRSPIGILRLDAGAPLTKNQSDGVQITFGVSQEF
jgi:translocation and assembly module TamA